MCNFGERTDSEGKSLGYGKIDDCGQCSCANSPVPHTPGQMVANGDGTTTVFCRTCHAQC